MCIGNGERGLNEYFDLRPLVVDEGLHPEAFLSGVLFKL